MIDWNRVRKEAKRLKVFEGHYDPTTTPFENQHWNVVMSTRSGEKTTGYVLMGMIIHQMTGMRVEYCRLMPDDVTPKKHRNFFDSIKDLKYIERITHGEYNDCFYKAGFWYYRYVDDEGNVERESTEGFMHVFAVRQAMNMKSSYTSNSEFIIFDEFIDPTKIYLDDFVLLCDCISTIFRQREGYINLLANTIDRQSVWFRELNIARDVLDLKQGESKRIQHEDCSPVLVSILAPKQTQKRQSFISKIFSFKNSKLESITGTSDGWAMRLYPRMPKGSKKYLMRNIYLDAYGFRVRIDLVEHELVGLCCNVVDVDNNMTELEDDAVLFTLESIRGSNEYHLFNTKLGKVIKYLYDYGLMYYGSNQAGNTWDSYMKAL